MAARMSWQSTMMRSCAAAIGMAVCSAAFAGNVLRLAVLPDAVLDLAPPVTFGPLASTGAGFEVATSTPVLCTSFAASGAPLRLLDSNLEQQLLPGVASVRYGPSPDAVRLQPVLQDGQPLLQCRAIPEPAAPASASTDALLRSGFERVVDTVLSAEGLNGQALALIEHVVGGQATWRVRIANRGEVATTALHIREYLPRAGGLLSPAVSTASCQIDGLPCAIDSEGRARIDLPSLAPGESRLLELTRSVASSDPGATAIAAIAVFSAPGGEIERSPDDAVVAVRLQVQGAGSGR